MESSNILKINTTSTDISTGKKYRSIVIDPPWNQGKTGKRKVRPNQTTVLDYPTMTRTELEQLPIEELAESEAFMWLWATNSKDRKTGEPILKTAFDLMETWGFTFYTMLTWHKRTGPCPFGPYQVVTEHVLFGYRGKCRFESHTLGKMQTLFTASPTLHSAKPASFYDQVERYFPSPRIDIFARQQRSGFDGWGNQYETLALDAPRPRSLEYVPHRENILQRPEPILDIC
jgi:N6-adenosine-specific RNA methylase IME4